MNGMIMNTSTLPLVVGKDGLRGRLQTETEGEGTLRGLVLIHLEDGRQIHIPQDILHRQDDGSFLLPLNLTELEQAYSSAITRDGNITVPVIAEELQVGTRTIETGRVLLHKTVQEHESSLIRLFCATTLSWNAWRSTASATDLHQAFGTKAT